MIVTVLTTHFADAEKNVRTALVSLKTVTVLMTRFVDEVKNAKTVLV